MSQDKHDFIEIAAGYPTFWVSTADSRVTRIEALRCRSLRYVAQPVLPFQVLVGANASGKSTFLDTVAFVGDLLRAGLEAAVQGDIRMAIPQRAPDARHLVWLREGGRFELSVEVAIPPDRRAKLKNGAAGRCRYDIAIDVTGPPRLSSETLCIKPKRGATPPLEHELSLLLRGYRPQGLDPAAGLLQARRKGVLCLEAARKLLPLLAE